jgi:O-acetyl-ADP-ribose deacetylase (regulator of RNase III)
MKIYLADLSDGLIQAWKKVFVDQQDIEIYHGSIFDLKADAIVSPANSFGFMDGVTSVAIPGLGTGVGQVPPEMCARQMYQAVSDILWQEYKFPGSWMAAVRVEEYLTEPSKDWQ